MSKKLPHITVNYDKLRLQVKAGGAKLVFSTVPQIKMNVLSITKCTVAVVFGWDVHKDPACVASEAFPGQPTHGRCPAESVLQTADLDHQHSH